MFKKGLVSIAILFALVSAHKVSAQNDNARATAAVKECWKQRLQALKKDLGYDDARRMHHIE